MEKRPDSVVFVLYATLVPVLVMTASALGTAAPDWSTTEPVMVAERIWADAVGSNNIPSASGNQKRLG